MSISVNSAPTKAELDDKLVEFVFTTLSEAIDARGVASLVVSGGSTPKAFFAALSQKSLDWSKVTITLADERCVPDTDDVSNAKLVAENLLQNAAAEANFEPTFIVGEGLEACRERFKSHAVLSQTFDVVILGMGGDAHTASIFPEATARDVALDLDNQDYMVEVDPVTVTPLRYTLTRRKLLDTRNLLLHITGASKWEVFEAAKVEKNPAMPISYFVFQDQVPLSVFFAES